ncbi:hypothetical protein AVEN_64165-1, partial [Araneus ventricosus]
MYSNWCGIKIWLVQDQLHGRPALCVKYVED